MDLYKQRYLNLETWSRRLWSIVRAILLIGMSFVILYPILLKISAAFKTQADLTNPTVMWIPETFSMDNIKLAIEQMDYWNAILNSFTISAMTTLLQTISCALAGYAFARLPFRGINILFAGVILTILVPPQTILVPMYVNFKSFDIFGLIHLVTGKDGLNLLDTYWPFILTAITGNALKSGLFIYIFRQFFRGLSKEIEEAAFVDGAGVFKSFTTIMLPNAIPAAVTVMLFAFVWQWNDTFISNNFLPSMNTLTNATLGLPYKVNVLLGNAAGVGQIDPFYASMLSDTGLLLSILPLIVMYFIVQRYFVESIDRTGLVG